MTNNALRRDEMAKMARFADGTIDVYKGRRAVTVGWQLTTPEGQKFSGHSLDAAKARATAASYAKYGAPFRAYDKPVGRNAVVSFLPYLHQQAVKGGYKNAYAAYADYQTKLAARRAACKIEIVDL